jgi:GntR family transcriptional regulator of vanillate catabolism
MDVASQTGRAVLNLREMLLRGDFPRGERISELSLVAPLGASRTPIRLALERLAHEGLLEVWPTGGFIVREFTMDDVWDAIEVRGLLEGAAAKLAAERLVDETELASLHKCREEMDAILYQGGDEYISPSIDAFARYMDLNEIFHSTLLDLAKSPMLRRTLEQVISLPFASPSAMVYIRSKLPRETEMFAIGEEQHRAILEAVQKRQGHRAESLAREHACLSRRVLELSLSDKDILSSVPGGSLIKA